MSFIAFSTAIDDRVTGTATATVSSPLLSQLTLGIGSRNKSVKLASKYANRHGLITGATGSGKTRSLVRLAAEFNRIGTPVFAPDMKGDLAALVSVAVPAGVPAVKLVPGVNFRLSLRRLGGDLTARALGLSDAQRGALDSYLDAGCESPAAIKHYPHRFAAAATERAMARGLNRLDSNNFGGNSFDVAKLIVKPARVHVPSGSRHRRAGRDPKGLAGRPRGRRQHAGRQLPRPGQTARHPGPRQSPRVADGAKRMLNPVLELCQDGVG